MPGTTTSAIPRAAAGARAAAAAAWSAAPAADPACWLAVASAEHVARGRAHGFMQVCHGKAAPLRRLRPGDRIVYYSPTGHFGAQDRLQAFTAIGTLRAGVPYQVDCGEGFQPFRRDVDWWPGRPVPLAALRDRLALCAGPNWGRQLRYGLLGLAPGDLGLIAAAMAVPAARLAPAEAQAA